MKKSEATRTQLLETAFRLIYTKGYQTTSIDDILAETKVTKGAFYYHFKSKDEMGLAIINEVMKPALLVDFSNEENNAHPLDKIYHLIKSLLLENEFLKVEYGCPAGNFTQEMTPWNPDFSEVLIQLVDQWQNTLIDEIQKGVDSGLVRKKTKPEQVALYIMSGYWGIRNFGKLYNSKEVYLPFLKALKFYLNSLKK